MTTKIWVLLGSVYAIGCGGGTAANHSACDAAAAGCARATAAWIVFNVKPDADCHDSSSQDGPSFPSGLFDIGGPAQCEHPYVAHFLVDSLWMADRKDDQVLETDSAKITLKTVDGHPLS
jgi:hypothetical protein